MVVVIVQRRDIVEEECFVQVIKTHLKAMIAVGSTVGVYIVYTRDSRLGNEIGLEGILGIIHLHVCDRCRRNSMLDFWGHFVV